MHPSFHVELCATSSPDRSQKRHCKVLTGCRQAGALVDFLSKGSSNANFVYDSLSDFTTPVLLIAGQQDLILPVAADQIIAELVPGALLVEVSLP